MASQASGRATPPGSTSPRKAHWSTMFIGVLGLLVLCPLVQWLELGSEEKNSLSAVALPPMAVVMLCGVVLAALLACLVKRVRPQADFILLYAMFLVGATVCSSGLARPIYGHITTIMDELIARKVDSHLLRSGYEKQDARAFPKLTTPLPAPITVDTPDKRTREAERAVQYKPLVEFSNGLQRGLTDIPPRLNHPDPRYELGNRVKGPDGKETLQEKPWLESTGIQLSWWWNERFLRDNFGGIKKDVNAANDIAMGAGTQPTTRPTTLPAYDAATLAKFKANPPGGFNRWLAQSVLGNVSATYETRKLVLVPAKGTATSASGSGKPAEEYRTETTNETRTIPWELWGWPIFNWTVFSLLIIGFMVCLAEVLRRIWLRVENLPMPLVEVPDGLLSLLPDREKSETRRGGASVLLMVGVLIGLGYFSLQAAQNFKLAGFERLPTFASGRIDLSGALGDPPWKYIGGAQLWYSPLLIAVGCLVSLEVSRSVWSIYGLAMVGLMVLGMANISDATMPSPLQVKTFAFRPWPYWDDQLAGAMLIMSLWTLWSSRAGIWQIFRELWCKVDPKAVGESYVPPRVLPILLVVLGAAIPAYAWYMGVNSVLFLTMLLGLFFLFTIAAARLRAETGFMIAPAMASMHRYSVMLGGARVFGSTASVVGNSFFWLSNSLISTLLPAQLEVIALSGRHRVSLKRMAGGMLLAAVVAMAISMPLALFWQYSTPGGMAPSSTGVAFAGGKDVMYIFYRNAGRNLDQGQFETVRLVATGVGAAIMLTLLLSRSFVLGFPLHPIGYVVVAAAFGAGVYYNNMAPSNVIWGPMLLAWLLKSAVFKIGGSELFARLLPIFRGVILGHLGGMVLWAILRPMIDPTMQMFFTW